MLNRLSRAFVERGMWMGQPDRPRWQIAAGLSGIDTMDSRSECCNYCGHNDNREDCQRASLVAPIEIVVHKQHLPKPESADCVGQFRWCSPLVTGLYRSYRGFGFLPCFVNGVGCKRDIRCVGLRHPVNDGARLRQRIKHNVKSRFCLRGLAEAGIEQNHQEAEADQTSFHGSFPSTAITQNRKLCSDHLDKKAIGAQLFKVCPPMRAAADERRVRVGVLRLRRVPG
jgi:hypothetical protein